MVQAFLRRKVGDWGSGDGLAGRLIDETCPYNTRRWLFAIIARKICTCMLLVTKVLWCWRYLGIKDLCCWSMEEGLIV
jgi:hypothetical protein